MRPIPPDPPKGAPVDRRYYGSRPSCKVHTWGRWRRQVLHWDSMHTVAFSCSWAELVGVDRPITPGWSRTCRDCRSEERS